MGLGCVITRWRGSERLDGFGGGLRGPQARIAAISCLMPTMFITRVRL